MKGKTTKRIRVIGKLLFVLYIAFLIYFLLFSDWYGRVGELGEYRYNLEPLKEIKRFWNYREQLGIVAYENLIGNIIIFAPFGFFMPMASKYKSCFLTVLLSFCLSLFVEVFQFVTRVGSFDVDDILLNTLGGLLGYIIFLICSALRRRKDAKNKKK